MQRVGRIDWAGQRDAEGLGILALVRRQAALVQTLRYDGGERRRLGAAANQNDQERAAGRGGPYDSVTTNGLPPTLALISGTAATASALLAYSPTRTL
jgi:hypothetical protein